MRRDAAGRAVLGWPQDEDDLASSSARFGVLVAAAASGGPGGVAGAIGSAGPLTRRPLIRSGRLSGRRTTVKPEKRPARWLLAVARLVVSDGSSDERRG